MSDVFRSLCAELVDWARLLVEIPDPPVTRSAEDLGDLLARARAELAKTEQALPVSADIAAVIESEQLNPWKAELIDALVCSHILQEEHYSNPRKALNDLIAWEAKVATDPRISSIALQKPRLFAEEPPTADDADDDGFIWGLDSHLNWKQTHWRLIGKFGYEYWLPLWALPLPTAD